MGRNRKRSNRMSVMAGQTARIGSVIFLLFIMVFVNMLANSSCGQVSRTIGEKEKLLDKLEAERVRESSRWEAMLVRESLDEALRRHGLAMRTPRPDQYVKMRPDGTPVPQQANLAALRRHSAPAPVAQAPRRRRR